MKLRNMSAYVNKYWNGDITLTSYSTMAVDYKEDSNKMTIYATNCWRYGGNSRYSNTTRKHLSAFFDDYFGSKISVSDIYEYYDNGDLTENMLNMMKKNNIETLEVI